MQTNNHNHPHPLSSPPLTLSSTTHTHVKSVAMMRLTTACRCASPSSSSSFFSRLAAGIPRVPHHRSRAKVKWATYTFWYVIDPLLRCHFSFYRRKAQLDQVLERNSILTNCGVGVIVGLTLYFTIVRGFLVPPSEGAKEHSMKENSAEIFELMDVDTSKGLPAFQLMRIKREVIGKLHTVSDLAEVRKQRREVEDFQRLMSDIDAKATATATPL